MARDPGAPPRTDDGVRITSTATRSTVVPGLVLLGLAGWLVLRMLRTDPTAVAVTPPPRPPGPLAAVPSAVTPAGATTPDTARPAAAPVNAASEVTHDPEAVAAARQRREERRLERRDQTAPRYTLNPEGEQQGIEAFPPPGTKP